jgi:hypothetical protein
LHIIFYTILEETLDCPWYFWYKVLKVGRINFLSYAKAISIGEDWPT